MGVKPLRVWLHFQSLQLSTRTLQNWLTCCRNDFFLLWLLPGDSLPPIYISSSFPLSPPPLSVYLTLLFFRPDVAVHQPGHPHLHRVLGDPQGAGSPLLQDPVSHTGCPQYLRALGKSQAGLLFLLFAISPCHLIWLFSLIFPVENPFRGF